VVLMEGAWDDAMVHHDDSDVDQRSMCLESVKLYETLIDIFHARGSK
jgi:hypothetical protein